MIYVVMSDSKYSKLRKEFRVASWGTDRITTKGDANNLLTKVLPTHPSAEVLSFKNMGEAYKFLNDLNSANNIQQETT